MLNKKLESSVKEIEKLKYKMEDRKKKHNEEIK